MSADEERIALFLDYENLAIGARENLGGMVFDFKPVADALAERGRVVVRRAYADWLKFGEDGRMLTRFHVELIEIPQRMGSVRKNAADIKMAVDAVELCLERDYITTFVLGTGDSDFTPLVHKLREHNKQVIGLGVQMSTSALLPPACDEFLFYERLEGVEVPKRRIIVPRGAGGRRRRPQVGDVGEVEAEVETDAEPTVAEATSGEATTIEQVERLITQTLSGLERAGGGVRASSLKRAILRKESTFDEADHGFRGFTELLRSFADRGVIELVDSASPGDPDVQFPAGKDLGEVGHAFELLATTVERLSPEGSAGAPLSGLKTQLRKADPNFSEKRFGFGGFLQFVKAAGARGMVEMAWNDDADDYLLTPVGDRPRLQLAPAPADTGETETTVATTGAGSSVAEGDESAEEGRSRRSRRGRGRGRGRGDATGSTEGESAEPAEAGEVTTTEAAVTEAGAIEPVADEATEATGLATDEADADDETAVAEPAVAAPEAGGMLPVEAAPAPDAPAPDATAPAEAEPAEAPRPRRRTSTRKSAAAPEAAAAAAAAAEAGTETAAPEDAEAPAKKPAARRRRSTKADAAAEAAGEPVAPAADGAGA